MKTIIHCSDSTWGSATEIDKWHKQKGWSGIGYHFVILNEMIKPDIKNTIYDGLIETGRPFNDDSHMEQWEMGAHVRGYNSNSIGICLIGKSGDFTFKQMIALHYLCSIIKEQFKDVKFYQHSDFDPKKPNCAGLDKNVLLDLNAIK